MTDSGSTAPLSEDELADLFRNHRNGLAGAVHAVLGRPDDAPEILQDAFLRALRALRKGTRPADPAAWIFVVTLNTARDRRRWHARRRGDRGLEEVSEMELASTENQTPAAHAAHTEALAAARAAILRLDDAEKEVFLMRVSGGLSFEAAATALGIPIGTAKTRMRRALSHLRTDLAEFAPEAFRQETT